MTSLEQTTLTVGETLDLICTVSGEPAPEIQWLLNGTEQKKVKDVLVESSKDGTQHLQIKSVRLLHGGEYKCVAKNKVGSVETKATISIEGQFILVKNIIVLLSIVPFCALQKR